LTAETAKGERKVGSWNDCGRKLMSKSDDLHDVSQPFGVQDEVSLDRQQADQDKGIHR
jgi:hypothetical protein